MYFFTSQILFLTLNFLTFWLVEHWLTLATQCWNRNQVYSSVTLMLTTLHWHQHHILYPALQYLNVEVVSALFYSDIFLNLVNGSQPVTLSRNNSATEKTLPVSHSGYHVDPPFSSRLEINSSGYLVPNGPLQASDGGTYTITSFDFVGSLTLSLTIFCKLLIITSHTNINKLFHLHFLQLVMFENWLYTGGSLPRFLFCQMLHLDTKSLHLSPPGYISVPQANSYLTDSCKVAMAVNTTSPQLNILGHFYWFFESAVSLKLL